MHGQSPAGLRRGQRYEWVSVGSDHDTGVFAVKTIGYLGNTAGRNNHAHVIRLPIQADGSRSNGWRARSRKTGLAVLARENRLEIYGSSTRRNLSNQMRHSGGR
ncbi:ISAzo13-like element transposase-related protein [Paeniglutamicibacter cryotolerans]|uniref:ISAzo13-like element transposase-related protein n=1 Tax=Paeniglutamicibacter cryotolerans TaxID=670079 RepID=UPI00161EC3E9